MLPSLLITSLHLAVIALSAIALGRIALRVPGTMTVPGTSFKHSDSHRYGGCRSRNAAIGFGIIAYIIFILIQTGMATTKNLSALWVVLTLFALHEIKNLFQQRKSKVDLALGTLLGIDLLWNFVWTYLPAADRDEMIYHLEIPRQWLQHSGRTFFQDNVYAYFPQLGENLMLFGLGTAGEWAAKLYQSMFGFFLCAALYEFCRRQKISKPFCLAAVLFFLGSPVVLVTLPLAYVDVTYSFYVFLAVTAVLRFQETLETKWILMAGVMAGFACCTKFTGFQFLILLSVLALIVVRGHFFSLLLMNAVAMAIVSPYLIRNFFQTGWPLIPFQTFHLPLNPMLNWDAGRARLYLEWLGTFEIDGMIGPLFLLTPFLLIKTHLTKTIKTLLIFSLLFLYYWFSTTRQSRFLIPLIPFLSVLLAWGLDQKKNILFRIAAGAFLIWNFTLGIQELWAHDPMPYWLGKETREQYLKRHIPQYGIYQEANKILGPEGKVYLIHMKNYGYYLDVPWRGDFIFERYELNRDFESHPSQEILRQFFAQRAVTHLLIDEEYLAAPEIGFKPEALKVFHEFLALRGKLLRRDQSYALYQLK